MKKTIKIILLIVVILVVALEIVILLFGEKKRDRLEVLHRLVEIQHKYNPPSTVIDEKGEAIVSKIDNNKLIWNGWKNQEMTAISSIHQRKIITVFLSTEEDGFIVVRQNPITSYDAFCGNFSGGFLTPKTFYTEIRLSDDERYSKKVGEIDIYPTDLRDKICSEVDYYDDVSNKPSIYAKLKQVFTKTK